MEFIHLWCSFRQRSRTCQSTCTNSWFLSNISFQFNSAFCALPDSVQFDQGSLTHSFRIREQFTSVPSDNRPPNKDGFIYGFSHFIQRRDPSSKRGYQQVNTNPFTLFYESSYWLFTQAFPRYSYATPISCLLHPSRIYIRAPLWATRHPYARGCVPQHRNLVCVYFPTTILLF